MKGFEDFNIGDVPNGIIDTLRGLNLKEVDSAFATHIRQHTNPWPEKGTPDKFWARKLFLEDFMTFEMEEDFPYITREFLLHEYSNLHKYGKVRFTDCESNGVWPKSQFYLFVLNLIYNAVLSGSEYAKALLLNIHKTYYRKEYKALKKFNVFSIEEFLSLTRPENDQQSTVTNMARLLCISELYGIDTSPCNVVYRYLTHVGKTEWESSESIETLDFDRAYLHDCRDEVESSIDMNSLKKKVAYHQRFMSNALRWFGYSPDYIAGIRGGGEGDTEAELLYKAGLALAVAKETYSKNKAPDISELAIYLTLFRAAAAFAAIGDEQKALKRRVIYGTDEAAGDEKLLFKPEEVMPRQNTQTIKAPETVKKEAVTEKDTDNRSLLSEIESLQMENHRLEADVRSLRGELAKKRKEEKETISLQEELDAARKELSALRSYVYNLGDDEVPETTVSIEKMRDAVKDLKILIIGGHPNWVSKLRRDFPKWRFYSPSVSGTTDVNVIDKADHVLFFTDTISHCRYWQFLNALREKKIPFGYIHGVNIEKNIMDVYKCIAEEK